MTKGKKKTWADLDHTTRLERITALWNEGKSDRQIANELFATKGQIVGYRHTHLPNVTAATRGTKSSAVSSPKTVQSAPTAKPQQVSRAAKPITIVQEKAPEPSAPPPPHRKELRMSSQKPRFIAEPAGQPSSGFVGKMTSDWTKQCGHVGSDSRQCGFHFTVKRGSEQRCNLHAHEIK